MIYFGKWNQNSVHFPWSTNIPNETIFEIFYVWSVEPLTGDQVAVGMGFTKNDYGIIFELHEYPPPQKGDILYIFLDQTRSVIGAATQERLYFIKKG